MKPLPWLSTLRPKALDLWRRGRRRFHPLLERARARLWVFAGIAVIVAILWGINRYGDWIVTVLWVWLGDTPDGNDESNSATVRNVGLVIAAAFALLFATWRSVVGWRQADTAQRSLLNERYQKGAEMLGSKVLSVRLGGIYALQRLAEEHTEEFHIQIMKLFCAFARHPAGPKDNDSGFVDYKTVRIVDPDEGPVSVRRLRPDVEAVMEAISARTEAQIVLEKEVEYVPQLSYADLRHLWLYNANLSGLQLVRANLSGAFLLKADFRKTEMWEADFTGARLNGAKFTGARLTGANFSSVEAISADFSNLYLGTVKFAHANLSGANVTGAQFLLANLSGTRFYKDGLEAKGLTQRQFDFARADPDNPPVLDGLIDSETGLPISWEKRRKGADG